MMHYNTIKFKLFNFFSFQIDKLVMVWTSYFDSCDSTQ